MTDLAGRLVAERFRIDRCLAMGGMGAVYQGVDTRDGRAVAIKTLLPEWSENQEMRQRLEREARAGSFLCHPNIVNTIALGRVEDGPLALVMELVRGESVGQILDRGPLDARRALVLVRQTLQALAFAHAAGLVHRDLKPDNLMVVQAGRPEAPYDQLKVLDFGLVKLISDVAASMIGDDELTRTGVVHGTPGYMPPEQALGRALDGRADLYAVGCILFEMLTGEPPYRGDDAVQLLREHIRAPLPSLAERAGGAAWVTPALDALVTGALRKESADRFPDAAAMTAALDAAFQSIDHVPNR